MKNNKTVFWALLVMLLWGLLFPLVKLGYSLYDISSTGDILYFAGIRFTICGAFICLYTYITDKGSYKAAVQSILPVLLSGVFAIILHYSLTYLGLKLTDSSKTAVLKQIGVLFYVCLSFLFIKDDRLTVKKTIGAIMGFAGILAINASADGMSFHIGDVLIIAASFCTVFSNVISKKLFVTVKPITATGISQLFGGIVLVIIGKILGGHMNFSLNRSYVMICICVASIFSYCTWFLTVKSGELSKLFLIKFAEPLFACMFGAVILGENIFKLQYLAAFLLIAGGIYISNQRTADPPASLRKHKIRQPGIRR